MALKFLDPKFNSSLNQRFRYKRFQFFENQFKKISGKKPIQILDIGGTVDYWKNMNFLDGNRDVNITVLNLDTMPYEGKNLKSVKGDACNLSEYSDKQFDIVYSNSVIEHLYTKENQKKMADEVRRVGKYYYVQTPNLYFPIEPHWLFPFFQFFPYKLKVLITRNIALGHIGKMNSDEKATSIVNEIRLLSEGEMVKLFPEGKVYREKFLGLTKSVTMYNFN